MLTDLTTVCCWLQKKNTAKNLKLQVQAYNKKLLEWEARISSRQLTSWCFPWCFVSSPIHTAADAWCSKHRTSYIKWATVTDTQYNFLSYGNTDIRSKFLRVVLLSVDAFLLFPGAGVALLNDHIYVVGGFDGVSHLDSVEVYNIRTDYWTTVASMTTPRCYVGATVLRGRLYAIAG